MFSSQLNTIMVKRLRGVCDPDPIQQDNKRSLLKQQNVLRNFLLHNHSSSSITIEIHHQQQQSAPQSTTLSTSFTSSSRPSSSSSNTNINNNINQMHYLIDLTHNDTPNNNDPHSNDDHRTPPPSIHSSCSASSINSSILKCNYNLKEIKQQYKTNNTTEIRSPDTNNINEDESIADSSDNSSDSSSADDDIEDGDTLNSESDRSVDTNSDMSQEYSIITENLYFLDDVSHHDEMIQCGLCNTTTTVTITNAR